MADIIHNFPTLFREADGRVHAETMLSGLGGVAGFATQMGYRVLIAEGTRAPTGVQMVRLSDGRRFLFGEAITDLLIKPDAALHSRGLWPLAAATARQDGCDEADLPDLRRQGEVVQTRLGTAEEGFPAVDEAHRPAAATAALMRRCWPEVNRMLCQGHPDGPGPLGPVPPILWATVMAHAAVALLRMTFAALDAGIGLQILFQSAVYGAKLDPSLFG